MPLPDICFIDIETTGLEPDYHEIIEIAVIRVDPRSLEIRVEMDAKVAPTHPERADPVSIRENGYSGERWADALPLVSVLEGLTPILQSTIVCGHDVAFDWAFLAAAYRRADLPQPHVGDHLIDTASMAWPLVASRLVERPTLEALCNYFDISSLGEQTAPAGARRTLEVYRRLYCLFDGGLLRAWLHMNPDERCIVATVAERVHDGRSHYGAWDVSEDERLYPEEALHEVMDGLSYCAAKLVRLSRSDT